MKDSDWSILTGPAVRQDPLVILGQDLVTCVQQSLVITLSLNIYKTSGVINIIPSTLTPSIWSHRGTAGWNRLYWFGLDHAGVNCDGQHLAGLHLDLHHPLDLHLLHLPGLLSLYHRRPLHLAPRGLLLSLHHRHG